MKEAFIIQDRSHYLLLKQKEYCIGSKAECKHLEDEGAVIIPWGKLPNVNEFTAIKSLRLRPTLEQVKKQSFPDFIRELPNLLFLEIPLPMVLNLNQQSLPKQLRTLMISNTKGYIELLTHLRKPITWPDVTLPHLKGLRVFNSFDAVALDTLLEISSANVPNLHYLDCQNDDDNKIVSCLSQFKSLSHLQISNVGNSSFFSELPNSLKYLAIFGAKKDFSLENIISLQKIESVWLNTIKTQINCDIFTSIPDLIEINILNSKKILNAKSLLNCVNLKSIFFLDCNKPFKDIAKLFVNDRYERLDIKYS